MFWRPSKELQACTRSEKIGTGTKIISYLVFQANLAKSCWHLCLLELQSLYVHVVQNLTQRWLSERIVSPSVGSVKGESHNALPSWRLLPRVDSVQNLKTRFLGFFYVLYSTLLHLPPLRFNCVSGCCTQFRISNTVDSAQTLTPSWLRADSQSALAPCKLLLHVDSSQTESISDLSRHMFYSITFLAQRIIISKF